MFQKPRTSDCHYVIIITYEIKCTFFHRLGGFFLITRPNIPSCSEYFYTISPETTLILLTVSPETVLCGCKQRWRPVTKLLLLFVFVLSCHLFENKQTNTCDGFVLSSFFSRSQDEPVPTRTYGSGRK